MNIETPRRPVSPGSLTRKRRIWPPAQPAQLPMLPDLWQRRPWQPFGLRIDSSKGR